MNKTLIVQEDSRYKNDSFIIIRPKSDYYKTGEKYEFINEQQLFLSSSYLKSVENYDLQSLPEYFCYLDKNCPKSIYLEIQEQVYKASNRLTLKEYPQFIEILKHYLGDEIFILFQPLLYQDFKPLTLIEITDLYKSQHYFNENTYTNLQLHIKKSFDKKQVSVLCFSNRTPEFIIYQQSQKSWIKSH